MIGYKLLPMKLDDYEFIYDVKKNAYIEYVEENFGTWNEEVQRNLYKKFIENNKDNIYVIVMNNERIGFYQGFILDNGDYEIGNICIIPKYQGMGIGTYILNDVIEKQKNKSIHIQYFKQNPVGKLYTKLGFVANGETDYHYQMIKYAKKNKN